MIKENTFVRIKKVILNPDSRSKNLPKETKRVPLVMWTKGFLLHDAKIGENVEVKTLSGRVESGVLVDYNHIQKVDYGEYIKELESVGTFAKEVLSDE